MSLPVDFAWFPDLHAPNKLSLRIGGMHGREVALVNERVDGAGWLTTTNRHLDWGHMGHSVLRSRDLAIRMATRWAIVHAERLRAQCAEKDAAMHRMAADSPTRAAVGQKRDSAANNRPRPASLANA